MTEVVAPPSRLTHSSSSASIHSHADSSVNVLQVQDEELYEDLLEQGPLTVRRLQTLLRDTGLQPHDPRLKQVHTRLLSLPNDTLSLENFKYVIESAATLIYRAIMRKLILPDWADFTKQLDSMYRESMANQIGEVATYIPELANADPSTWAVNFCSIDGQQHGCGNTSLPFSIQSTSKPLSYLIALQELGEANVHRFVGREPSGRNFNELCLSPQNIPHNPMINAGAIMCASLIKHGAPAAERFAHVMSYWKKLTGHCSHIGFNNTVYLSEKATANRNFCLAYLMQERHAFQSGADRSKEPREWKDTDLQANLDLYFQCCSIEATTQSMSIVAATLANGGVCPLTGERVFQAEYVKNCLALMLSCGMYDYSGEWGFVVGLPAKSGVSGLIMVVIPNVGGVAMLSPKLDELGNSARGIDFSRRLATHFKLHFLNFHPKEDKEEKEQEADIANAAAVTPLNSPVAGGASGKLRQTSSVAESSSPSTRLLTSQSVDLAPSDLGMTLIFACASGDMGAVRSLIAAAVDLNTSDYDGRTPLHLASSNGHVAIVDCLLRKGVEVNPVDRVGGTPLSDAVREGHFEVVNLLRAHNAVISVPNEDEDGSAAPSSSRATLKLGKDGQLISTNSDREAHPLLEEEFEEEEEEHHNASFALSTTSDNGVWSPPNDV